jgi:DNA-binding NtrC family response regulator
MLSDEIILVTGADLRDRETILQALGDECHVVASQTTNDALAHLGNTVHIVISEVKSDQCDGFELMRRWKMRRPETPFLMLVDRHDAATAVEAMKQGAADCIVKPIDADDVRSATQQLAKSKADVSTASANFDPPVGGHRKTGIDIPPDTSLEDLERAAVEQALIQHHGNRTHAARTLGISVRTLQRKLKAWGMPIMSLSTSTLRHSFLLGTPADAAHSVNAHVH